MSGHCTRKLLIRIWKERNTSPREPQLDSIVTPLATELPLLGLADREARWVNLHRTVLVPALPILCYLNKNTEQDTFIEGSCSY